MTTNNDKKKMKRSVFTEANELEKKLKVAKRMAAIDRENSLTAQNARDEVVLMLLRKAMREMFEKTDRLQGGSFIHGSMGSLSADMWKGAIKK